MSAFFDSASSQRLLNTATPITAYPITVGMWVRPTTTSVSKSFWQISSTAGTSNSRVGQSAANNFELNSSNVAIATTAGTVAANTWYFVVGRFVTIQNRQISVFGTDGSITTGSNTVDSDTPTSTANMAIGASAATTGAVFFDGNIGEWWITNTDIQPDGAALQNSTLRQLARGGPFSIPHIASAVVDYRSLRYALGSEQDEPPDYFSGNKGRQTWVNTGGVILGAHPPFLAPEYKRPGDFIRPGIV